MARTSLSGKSTPGMKTGTPVANGNASLRLEKSNPSGRRSTPDSEALASSDDEFDHQQHPTSVPAAPLPKPARRTSWLNEVPQILPRKGSIGTAAPTGSNPTTPSAEQSPWATNTSPGLNGSVSWSHGASGFPWGTGIWNSESRKEPPPRLTELSQSPTTSNPPNSSNINDEILSPTARTLPSDSSIPFNIPLHPTPKTYRSQSYSVGQLDPEVVKLMTTKTPQYNNATRGRNTGQYSGLQHRSSRPSMLGELGHDPAMLGRVREDDDDETSTNGSENGYQYSTNQARTIEQLTRENALLRQAASQLDSSRLRDRAASSVSANSVYSITGTSHNTHRIPVSVPEEADLAVEDLDELGDIHPGYGGSRANARRRFSEHSANLDKQLQGFTSLENRPLESIKKAHWQTSLGFGSIGELPQSRRHSFADIPPRHPSISSVGDNQANFANISSRSGLGDREEAYTTIPETAIPTSPTENAFYGREHLGNDAGPSGIPPSLQHVYNNISPYNRHQPSMTQPHQNQLLYIVTFKCHRADVFYIQEDTGLQVKLGDLVIVEADRGTDLGTIQHVNVTWQRAKELKEQYLEDHYKLLMLFSRQSQSGASNVVNPGIGNRSAIGGMGPPGTQGAHETQSTEIKPKLIKRLAQNHEILTLREKEGNEAKAKRVCQQKVADHRLNMEILDAEFQMDWKKLTFYYFADSYINFNSLVTDLFKIYKTRIWMSAINPASFVTPSAGLPPPGPSGSTLAYGQDHSSDRRPLHDPRAYNIPQIPTGTATIRDSLDPQLLRSNYLDPYQAFGHVLRQPADAGISAFGHPGPLQHDPFSSYPSAGYGTVDSGFSDYSHISNAVSGPSQRGNQGQGEWINRFQGLSLGS